MKRHQSSGREPEGSNGDTDIPEVHAHACATEAGIPRARRVVIKDMGHPMYLEEPAEFSRIVIELLEKQ